MRLVGLINLVQTQDLGFCWAVLVQPLVLALLVLVRLWTTEKRLRFAGLGWKRQLGLGRREQTEKCRPPVMLRLLERHKQGLPPLDLRVLALLAYSQHQTKRSESSRALREILGQLAEPDNLDIR
jgi:hypothetical protein